MDCKLHSSEFVINKLCRDKVEDAKIYLEKNANIKLRFSQCFDDKQWISLSGITKEDVFKVQHYIECYCNPDHTLIVNTLSKPIINLLQRVLSFRWHIECSYGVVITICLPDDVTFSGCDFNVVQASSALDVLNSRYNISKSLLSDLNPTAFEDFIARCDRFHLRHDEIKLIQSDLLYTLISWLENQENLENFKNADVVQIIDEIECDEIDSEVAEIIQNGHSETSIFDSEAEEIIQHAHSSTPVSVSKDSENTAVAKLSTCLSGSIIVISDNEESFSTIFTGISETALGNIRRQGLELGYSEKELENLLEKCAVNGKLPPVANILQHLRMHRLTVNEQSHIAPISQSTDSMDVEITLEEREECKDKEAACIITEDTRVIEKKSAKCRPTRRIAANFPSASGMMHSDTQLPPSGTLDNDVTPSFSNAPQQWKSDLMSRVFVEDESFIGACLGNSANVDHLRVMTTTAVQNKYEQLRKDQQSLLDKSFHSNAAENDIALSKQMRAVIADPPPPGVVPENLRYIVVDASNVAVSYGNQQFFDCRGILFVVQWFLDRGHRGVLAVLPRHRRGTRGGPFPTRYNELLDDLERQNLLAYTPSRYVDGRREAPHDDAFILKIAADHDAVVVSNDQYRDFMNNERFATIIRDRLLSYTVAMGKIYFAEDPFGVGGISLDQLLSLVPISPLRQKAKFTKHNRDTLNYVHSMNTNSAHVHADNFGRLQSQLQNGSTRSASPSTAAGFQKTKKSKRKRVHPQQSSSSSNGAPCDSERGKQHVVDDILLNDLLILFPANREQIHQLLLERPDQQDVNILSNMLMDRLSN